MNRITKDQQTSVSQHISNEMLPAVLRLSLKKKWFNMTKSGVKTEDYREINDYWIKRLCSDWCSGFDNVARENVYMPVFKEFTKNIMTLGYPSNNDKERIIEFEHKGIEIRTGNSEWGAVPGKQYFVIIHGAVIV